MCLYSKIFDWQRRYSFLDSRKWFLRLCWCKYERRSVREFASSHCQSIYTWEESNTFSPFVLAISFLSEESYPIPFVLCVLSPDVGERERTCCKPRVLFIFVRKCALYTQIKFVPDVRFACELHRWRRRAFTAFSLRKMYLHRVRCGGFCGGFFFSQLFVEM